MPPSGDTEKELYGCGALQGAGGGAAATGAWGGGQHFLKSAHPLFENTRHKSANSASLFIAVSPPKLMVNQRDALHRLSDQNAGVERQAASDEPFQSPSVAWIPPCGERDDPNLLKSSRRTMMGKRNMWTFGNIDRTKCTN